MLDIIINKNWDTIGSEFYQLKSFYPFDSTLIQSSSDKNWIPSYNGGMFLRLKRSSSPIIDIINNGGFLMGKSVVIKNENVHSIFWCHNGYIGILDYFSNVQIISTHGDIIETYKSPVQSTIRLAVPFFGGICFINESFQIFTFLSNMNGFIEFGKLDGKSLPILLDFGFSSDFRGYIVLESKQLLTFNSNGIQQIGILASLPSKIQCYHNGNIVGISLGRTFISYFSNGKIYQNFNIQEEIIQFCFLDELSVAILDLNELIIYQGHTLKSLNLKDIYLITSDYDGIKIYSKQVYILNKIHSKLKILNQNTLHSQISILNKSYNLFKDQDITCHSLLEELKDDLENIVVSIIDATPHIFDLDLSEKLLTIAAFAKYQLPNFKHDSFSKSLILVRLLNSLRKPYSLDEKNGFGFLTTAGQLEIIQINDFINMISQLRLFDLAGTLCDYFQIDPSIVAESWARFILTSNGGINMLPQVLKHISNYSNINYLSLAYFSKNLGINDEHLLQISHLIKEPIQQIKFLDDSKRFSHQILPALLELKDGSSILIHLFTLKLKNQKLFETFLLSNSIITEMYINYQRYISVKDFENYKNITNNKLFELLIIHTTPPEKFGRDNEYLNKILSKLEKNSIYFESIKKHISINDFINNFKEIHGTGSSPSPRQYMERALVLKNNSLFDKIVKLYNCDDKIIAITKVKTFINYKELNNELINLANSLSSKLPFNIYAELCFNNNLINEGIAFTNRISKKEEKLNIFKDNSCWLEAAKIADELKKPQLAAELKSKI